MRDGRVARSTRRTARGVFRVFCLAMGLALGSVTGARAASESASPAPARRIVSLAPSATEILFALGAGDRLVGVCSYCDYPAEVAGLPRVGTFTSPSIESIIAARPDLVIGARGPATVGAIAAATRLEYVAVGPTVNVASRLADRADAGQVLVDARTVELNPGERFEPLPAVHLKGFSVAVPVFASR